MAVGDGNYFREQEPDLKDIWHIQDLNSFGKFENQKTITTDQLSNATDNKTL